MASQPSSSSSTEKKRTRPVSACENCRSRKVKCNLKPDVPICEGCSTSGKECIFRIDDLSPALRKERFGQYGPPGENARQIASRKKKSRLSQDAAPSSNVSFGDCVQDKGQMKKQGSSIESAHSPPSGFRSSGNYDQNAHLTNSRHKANGINESVQNNGEHNAQRGTSSSNWMDSSTVPSPRFGDHRSSSNSTHNSDVILHHNLASMYSAPVQSSTFVSPFVTPLDKRISSISNIRSAGLPSFRSSFPNKDSIYEGRNRSASSSSNYSADAVRINNHTSPDRSERVLQMSSWRDEDNSESKGYVRPSSQSTHMSHSHLLPSHSESPSSLNSHIDTHRHPSRNDLAASYDFRAQREPVSNYEYTSNERERDLHNGRSTSAHNTNGADSEISNKTSSSQRIALPFFRWFGATANTPGIRRIKVGVYHDADEGVGTYNTTAISGMSTTQESAGSTRDAEDDYSKGVSSGDAETLTSPASRPTQNVATPAHSLSEADSVLSASSRELFEPERPRYPRKEILIHLTKLFFKLFHSQCFAWIDEGEIIAGAESGNLPAILANSICALTARFSNRADLRRCCNNGNEPFADMAKILIIPMLSWPSIEVIEALVIISYAEFAAGSDSGLWNYVGLALRMSSDLGLQHEMTIRSMRTQKEQVRARLLFWAIISLDRITCFGTGRPLTMRDDSIDIELPTLKQDATSSDFVFGHIIRVLLKRGRIGELLNRKTDETSLEERGQKLKSMWIDLAEYYETLPTSLRFGVNSFRRLANVKQGAAFVYLHVLLQSTLSLLNRPSLLRKFDREFAISAPSKLTSIANHASGTIVSILRFAQDAAQERKIKQGEMSRDGDEDDPNLNPYIDGNPYLDQLILPAGRAFLSEREAAKDALARLGHNSQSRPMSRGMEGDAEVLSTDNDDANKGKSIDLGGPFQSLIASREYAQANLMTSQEILDRLSTWWKGASWPARALRQEAAGAMGNEVRPDGNDEEAQPVSVRDVEMVLKWARARAKMSSGTKTPAIRQQSQSKKEDLNNNSAEELFKELSTLLGSQHSSGDTTMMNTSTPPVGLGFSGSFGSASDVDIQALIDAWANEQNFSTNNQHSQTMQWSASVDAMSQHPLDQQQEVFLPQSVNSNGLQLSSDTIPFGADLEAMQLEELFFKSNGGIANGNLNQGTSPTTTNESSSILNVPINYFDEALFSMLSPFVNAPKSR